MKSVYGRMKSFFTQLPLPSAAFQVTSSYVSGIHFPQQDKSIKSYFILPLKKGLIESSFYKNNIKNPDLLKEAMESEMTRLEGFSHTAAFLLPELSQKVFAFKFDSLPPSRGEKEQIFRFRIQKQMPLLPDDCRIAFDIHSDNTITRALVSVARSSVIQEYEDFFHTLRFKIRQVGIPSLSLLNLISFEQEKDIALIDIEQDSFSLVVVINSRLFLYRQKPFIIEPGREDNQLKMASNIAQEIENTLNLIEDKEKKTVNSIWVRLGVLDFGEKLFARLEEKFMFPVVRIESAISLEMDTEEKRILAPLIGQVT